MAQETKVESEIVYFVAVRTANPQGGVEIPAVMRALNETGLIAQPPLPDAHYAIAWYRRIEDLTANDHECLRALGLGFDDANAIATVAWKEVTPNGD